MNKTCLVYKVVDKDFKDMNRINDYSKFNHTIKDSTGINFEYSPIDVFQWSYIFNHNQNNIGSEKYLVLEIDPETITEFPLPTNNNSVVKRCRVLREMNENDIVDYIKHNYNKTSLKNLNWSLKLIQDNSRIFWDRLRSVKEEMPIKVQELYLKLDY